MKCIFYILFGLVFFNISCESEKISNQEITKITLVFSGFGCEGNCPFFVLSANKNLELNYYAGAGTKQNGFFKGTMSQNKWDSVQIKFNKFLDVGFDKTDIFKTDQPDIELVINYGLKNKDRFKMNLGDLSDNDVDILLWYSKIKENSNLIYSDSINFETSIQYKLNGI